MTSRIHRLGCAFLLLVMTGCSTRSSQPGQASSSEHKGDTSPPPRSDPGACGEHALTARFAACKQAAAQMAEAPCKAAGGAWGRIGLHEGCNCPTGQAECPCTRAGDCLGKCLLEPESRACPATLAGGTWRCSAYHDVVGCHCFVDADGRTGSICID